MVLLQAHKSPSATSPHCKCSEPDGLAFSCGCPGSSQALVLRLSSVARKSRVNRMASGCAAAFAALVGNHSALITLRLTLSFLVVFPHIASHLILKRNFAHQFVHAHITFLPPISDRRLLLTHNSSTPTGQRKSFSKIHTRKA